MHGAFASAISFPRSRRARASCSSSIASRHESPPTPEARHECLTNSEIVVRGHEGARRRRYDSAPESQPLFLFPHEGAVPLAQFAASREAGDARSFPMARGDKLRKCAIACRAFETFRACRCPPTSRRSIGCDSKRTRMACHDRSHRARDGHPGGRCACNAKSSAFSGRWWSGRSGHAVRWQARSDTAFPKEPCATIP